MTVSKGARALQRGVGSRWRVYPSYRTSGVEWLGEVPEGWEVRPLKRCVSFAGGGTPSTDVTDYWGGNIPWVSPKDMGPERLNTTQDSLTSEGLRNSPCRLVPAGSVLVVVRSGILKRTIPVAVAVTPVALNQDMKALLPGRAFDAEYLRLVVRGHPSVLLTLWRKQGATVESIEHECLANTPFPLPPRPEQRAIAGFLDRETARIDTLVERKESLPELLDEKRTALISRAVTTGLDPEVPMKDSGVEWLGEVPEEWEVVSLGSTLGRLVSGVSVNASNYPAAPGDVGVLKTSCVYGDRFNPSENKEVVPSDIARVACRVRANSLVISRMNTPDLVGACGFVEQSHPGLYLPDRLWQTQVRDAKRCCGRFLWYVVKSSPTKAMMRVLATGTSGSMKNLTQQAFSRIPTPLPPLPEQQAIAAYLDRETARIDTLKTKVQKAIDLLKEYRTALISAAVTGKIDVRGEVEEVVASAPPLFKVGTES